MLILIFSVMTLASCAASSDRSYQEGYDVDEGAPAETTSAAGGEGIAVGDVNQSNGNQKPAERMIIRNASLDMTAIDVSAVYESILAQAESYGGYELSRDESEQNDYTVISAALKLPPEHLDSLIEFIRNSGDLINIRISSNDITESYYDTEIRLANMEKSLDKYYEYLDDSRNIEESIMVQNQINSLTMEIESLKGKLKLWDSQLAESTVELYIRQVNDPVLIRKEVNWSALSWEDMTYLMTSGLKRVVNFLAGAGQWLLIVAVASAPLWIPLLIIVIILVRRNRKRRKQRALEMASQAAYYQQMQAQNIQSNKGQRTEHDGENKQ